MLHIREKQFTHFFATLRKSMFYCLSRNKMGSFGAQAPAQSVVVFPLLRRFARRETDGGACVNVGDDEVLARPIAHVYRGAMHGCGCQNAHLPRFRRQGNWIGVRQDRLLLQWNRRDLRGRAASRGIAVARFGDQQMAARPTHHRRSFLVDVGNPEAETTDNSPGFGAEVS